MSIPFTWPAPQIEGFAHRRLRRRRPGGGLHVPETLLAEIRERFGPLVLDHRFPIGTTGSSISTSVRRAAEQKVEIALWLVDRFEPELLFVVFMAADHVHHLCWDDWERRGAESLVADVYRILDAAAGALADAAARTATSWSSRTTAVAHSMASST